MTLAQDETDKLNQIVTKIHDFYKDEVAKASKASRDIVAYADVIIKVIQSKDNLPDHGKPPAEAYATALMNIDENKPGDLFNVCRTNVYLDAFKNSTNWDFCYKTDDDIIAMLISMVESTMLPPMAQ